MQDAGYIKPEPRHVRVKREPDVEFCFHAMKFQRLSGVAVTSTSFDLDSSSDEDVATDSARSLCSASQAVERASEAVPPRESKAKEKVDPTPKDRGNVFGNMMRSPKCPAHVKKEWDVLKSLGTKDVNRCEFVAQVIDAVNKGKLFDNDFFDKIKIKYTETVEHTELDRTKQGWKSYEWVAKEEGRIITDEVLKLKRLDDRRNLKLPSDSTLASLRPGDLVGRDALRKNLVTFTETRKCEKQRQYRCHIRIR